MPPILPQAHLDALLATARIAGVAGLVISAGACRARTTAPVVEAAPTPATTLAEAPPAPVPAQSPTGERRWTKEELNTCDELLSHDLAKVDYNGFIQDAEAIKARTSAQAVECCASPSSSQARWGCCAVSPDALACTPWGPPVPPAMA